MSADMELTESQSDELMDEFFDSVQYVDGSSLDWQSDASTGEDPDE